MKKVLFIIWTFSMGGGAEKILSEMLNNIDTNKYEVSVLEYHNFGIKEEEIPKNIKILPPILKVYKGNNFYIKVKNKLMEKVVGVLVKFFPSILRWIYIKEKYDIEIAFNYMIPTFLLSKDKMVKRIGWVHGDVSCLDYKKSSKKLKVWLDNKLQKKSYKYINNIVAISENTYNSIINVYPEFKSKTKIIYNGFDFDSINKKSNEKIEQSPKGDVAKILSVARLDDNKNQKLLLDATKILKDNGIDLEVTFIGKGEKERFLKDYAKNLNISECIRWEGFIKNPYPYMKEADIVCITSFSEGFPTVAIEALALGTYVVSTNVAGMKEITNNGEFGEVTSTDSNEYAKALEKVIINIKYYKAMATKGQIYVNKFSIEKQMIELERLIEGANSKLQ